MINTPPSRPSIKPLPAALERIATRTTRSVIGDARDVRKRSIAPCIDPEEGRLILTDGEGVEQPWGTPYCFITLHWITPKQVRIHVSFGGERWQQTALYYFRFSSARDSWTRLIGSHFTIESHADAF